MQLGRARLCLDCEELHEEQQCPVCASETFAYLTRWVPTREARPQPSPPAPLALSKTQKAVGFGIAGLGLLGLAQWIAKGRRLIEDASTRNVGELK